MTKCWERRGCFEDEEMMERCPHNVDGCPCPADCLNTHCQLPTHVMVSGIDALINPDIDRGAAMKETCLLCRFFLEHGPVIDADNKTAPAPRMAARALNIKTSER